MTSVMLSRVANAIYWMARYVERAENTARFIDVNLQLTLDRSSVVSPQWMPLVNITGDDQAFIESYGNADRDAVLEFLTLDLNNPNSIASCAAAARENARTIRETITTEMWEQVNELHHLMGSAKATQLNHHFFRHVKRTAMLFNAVTDSAMSRAIGWEFARLGRMIERADKTSRMLDVKYFLLLPSTEDVGTTLDVIQWRALLASVDAMEMYRQQYGTINPTHVADFLMFNGDFPRALAHCLYSAKHALDKLIPGADSGEAFQAGQDAQRCLGRLVSEVQYGRAHEVITAGLHEYLDAFQTKLNACDDAIHAAFFAPRLLEATG
ncbi:MAG: alpha-E domain-containing protein [Planctomycetota bacterium]